MKGTLTEGDRKLAEALATHSKDPRKDTGEPDPDGGVKLDQAPVAAEVYLTAVAARCTYRRMYQEARELRREAAVDALALCHLIEAIPAGEEQAAASVAAAALREKLREKG